MDNIKFFRILWRFNAIMIGLASIIIIAALIYNLIERKTSYQSSSVYLPESSVQARLEKEKWEFGGIKLIEESNTIVLSILSKQKFYSKETTATRNYIFINAEKNSYFWLFNNNDYIIDQFSIVTKNDVIRLWHYDSEHSDTELISLYFVVYKTDTNHDDAIKTSDKATIALTKPDGTGYTEIESGIDKVEASTVINDGKYLVLFFQKAGNFYNAKYDLETFKKVSEQQIETGNLVISD